MTLRPKVGRGYFSTELFSVYRGHELEPLLAEIGLVLYNFSGIGQDFKEKLFHALISLHVEFAVPAIRTRLFELRPPIFIQSDFINCHLLSTGSPNRS